MFNAHANPASQTTLIQTKNLVKANNKYITLLGNQVNIGDKAPNFKVVDKNFSPIQLTDFTGNTVLISVIPSLDTGGVSSLQTKRFNEEAAKLPKNITVLTISSDLPFAQKRFSQVENVDHVKVISDSVWRDFGEKYGLIIKDMGLLTRAIFVIDNQGIVKYKELVANISQPPDYESALNVVKAIAPVIVVENAVSTEDTPNKKMANTIDSFLASCIYLMEESSVDEALKFCLQPNMHGYKKNKKKEYLIKKLSGYKFRNNFIADLKKIKESKPIEYKANDYAIYKLKYDNNYHPLIFINNRWYIKLYTKA
jgi:thiol peroxidase